MKLEFIPQTEITQALSSVPNPIDKACLLADIARFNTLYMVMNTGSGHLGTSFSAMDIVSLLYTAQLNLQSQDGNPPDVYFSSKGHDAPGWYSLMIALGLLPFEKIHTLRKLGGLPGHPDVGTPHVEANTGSLGMGISKAKGMAHSARLQGKRQRCFVLCGDGELQEGQFWESMVSATNFNMGEITVIVDHNKIQSDTWVSQVSDLGDLLAKFKAFGWEAERCDGHDPLALSKILERFNTIQDRPKIILADTVKGKGVSFMEKMSQQGTLEMYRFHSGAPSVADYDLAKEELRKTLHAQSQRLGIRTIQTEIVEAPDRQPPQGQRLVQAYSRALVQQGEQHQNLVVLDADLMLDCGLIPFREKFPERFIECGIAEQDMVSQASGLALKGMLPIVHSFGCFLTPRANEQIYNTLTEHTKVIYVGSLVGLIPSAPGHSHQSVRDIALLACAPNILLLEPATEKETELAFDYCVNKTPLSCYLRLVTPPREVPFEVPDTYTMCEGVGYQLRGDSQAEVVIIGYGPVLLAEAWHAVEMLASRGIKASLYNHPWLNRMDSAWLAEIIADKKLVLTLDNHYLHGGQGDMIGRTLAELNMKQPPRFTRMGVSDIPQCGTPVEVLSAHKLNAQSIAETVLQALA